MNSYNDGTHDFADLLRAVGRGAGHPAPALHQPAPERLQRSRDRGDGRGADGVRARAPADAERARRACSSACCAATRARGTSTASRGCAPRFRASRSRPTSSSAFPGETDEDFEETLSAVREVGFDDAFTFKFSPRDGTPATRMPAELTVPDEVASERLAAARRDGARRRARSATCGCSARGTRCWSRRRRSAARRCSGAHARLQDGARAGRRSRCSART